MTALKAVFSFFECARALGGRSWHSVLLYPSCVSLNRCMVLGESQQREEAVEMLLVSASRESDISFTNPINHNKNVANVNIFKINQNGAKSQKL